MRIRKKTNRDARLERCESIHVKNPEKYKEKWNTLFGNSNPVHLEIGCGKGSFITQLAMRNPDINYVAMEKCTDVIIMAMEKAMNLSIPNLLFINGDAGSLPEIFSNGEISRIYINFCDPWPKSGHKKRRLTYRAFLDIYKSLLPCSGELHFKTDNRRLFEFSLNEFAGYEVKMQNISLDLHNSNFEGNIETEYEKNFSEKGFPIFRCELVFNDNN
ncbi:MAG: tRNA (guanosine(46)-N7)-methyltransferase TrmB [Bacillota bacterium]|nr:tRNA (guanosine(46)-N7)-methyltransferase TrmB [Bacillota bacterium]